MACAEPPDRLWLARQMALVMRSPPSPHSVIARDVSPAALDYALAVERAALAQEQE